MSARTVLSAKLLEPMTIEPEEELAAFGASGLLELALEEPQAVSETAAAEAMMTAAMREARPLVTVVVTVPFQGIQEVMGGAEVPQRYWCALMASGSVLMTSYHNVHRAHSDKTG